MQTKTHFGKFIEKKEVFSYNKKCLLHNINRPNESHLCQINE